MDKMIQQYEGLGYFYLGRQNSVSETAADGDLMLFKSNDLSTHAAIIGMTGSGKTGLGICLIEEAAIDNIPSLIIDPKGDMGNLLLAFPGLNPDDFLPWVEPADAEQKGLSQEEFARQTAETWKKGLASWDQPVSRISAYVQDRNISIYTPGSSAGRGLSLLSDFSPPPDDLVHDADTFSALVKTTVTSLLSLVGVTADPLQSVEFLLLSAIFTEAWQKGEGLCLETLIGKVVQPPFKKLGVLPLETVYPENKRMELAMRLNGILSSPGFSAWTRGEPLDIGNLLFDEKGKARITILSIAHLSDTERMFFVTLFLNHLISWMRRQSGTSTLRALLYMDEVFGYFPATANPPSKTPMLLLLKQARAFGIGIVLSTQNPVDLDYRGLSNIGSWFVGRLQTRQDVDRVLDGMAPDGNGFDKDGIRKQLTGLKGRHFILKNAKTDHLISFETRWTLSFLRGPVTEAEIRTLMVDQKKRAASPPAFPEKEPVVRKTPETAGQGIAPVLSAKIPQVYANTHGNPGCVFYPHLLASATVRYYNQARAIDTLETRFLKLPLAEDAKTPSWEDGQWLEKQIDMRDTPPGACGYAPLPAFVAEAANFRALEKDFADYFWKTCKLTLFRCREIKLESRAGEAAADFRLRVSETLHEKRDAALEKLKAAYREKEKKLSEKVEKARIRLEKEAREVSDKKKDTLISMGLTLVDAFFGGKRLSRGTVSRAGTTLRQGKRVFDEKEDVRLAEDALEKAEADLAALEDQLVADAAALSARFSSDTLDVEEFFIAPRKTDIKVTEMAVLWEIPG
ncbi:DUF87 domain-containing protein [Desulfosarcina sp. OttesenSCG-928-B08]|nr:DUF87 domain-containing protein [Desulfosarcina sp. OttesenSCG-928-B08]